MDQSGDEVNDFWVHIASSEIQRVGGDFISVFF